MWMNRYEVEEAVERHKAGTLAKAARILRALMTEVDCHSDGWPYWQAPAKAADKLMKLLQQTSATDKELRAALIPIRRFMTERGKKAGMDERVIFAAVETSVCEAPKTVSITPRGMTTAEGQAKVNAAMKKFEDSAAELANESMRFLKSWAPLIESLVSRHATPEDKELLEDLKNLQDLAKARWESQDEFVNAITGR